MDLLNHDITTEFPHLKDKIHALKTGNGHFAKLFDQYNETNHGIQKFEMGGPGITDEALEALKKQRLKLKDEIVGMLQAA